MRLPLLTAATVVTALTSIGCPPNSDDGTPPPAEGEGEAEPSSVTIFDADRIGSNGNLDNFHVIRGDFDVGDVPVSSAVLHVDLGTTCFPFSKWADDPPPPGHNWPPSCDAFDRNFHFLVDDPDDDSVADTVVPIELVRAITPFGGPLTLEVDVTDVVNGLVRSGRGGTHRLSAHITTYSDGDGIVSGSDGGWNVSATLDLAPGTPPRNVVDVQPLFWGNLVTGSEATQHDVDLADGQRGYLLVRTTGHGGPDTDSACFGPAEEFCRRDHRVEIDDVVDLTFTPLRDDCDDLCTLTTGPGPGGGSMQYCAENPTGAIESVRAPRANWCPGSVTPPFDFGVGDGGPAASHAIRWSVGRIAEGGSWLTSLVLFVLD